VVDPAARGSDTCGKNRSNPTALVLAAA